MNELTDKEILDKIIMINECAKISDDRFAGYSDTIYHATKEIITTLESRKSKRTVEEIRNYCKENKNDTMSERRRDTLQDIIDFIDTPVKGDGE